MKFRWPAIGVTLALAACGPVAGGGTQGSDADTTGTTGDAATVGTGDTAAGSSGTAGSSSSSDGPTTNGTSTATTDPGTSGCEFVCVDYELEDYCDPFTQDCPEGHKCTWVQDRGYAFVPGCVPVTGSLQAGDACVAPEIGHDDCGEGLMCWFVDGDTNEGVCLALCMGSFEAPSCPEGEVCVGGRALWLCVPECDPLGQDCGDGMICVYNQSWSCVLDASGGEHPAGTPCEFLNECNGGNMCMSTDFFPHPACEGAGGCCSPYCDLGDGGEGNPVCAPFEPEVPGVACQPFYGPGEAPAGKEHYGVCGLPW